MKVAAASHEECRKISVPCVIFLAASNGHGDNELRICTASCLVRRSGSCRGPSPLCDCSYARDSHTPSQS